MMAPRKYRRRNRRRHGNSSSLMMAKTFVFSGSVQAPAEGAVSNSAITLAVADPMRPKKIVLRIASTGPSVVQLGIQTQMNASPSDTSAFVWTSPRVVNTNTTTIVAKWPYMMFEENQINSILQNNGPSTLTYTGVIYFTGRRYAELSSTPKFESMDINTPNSIDSQEYDSEKLLEASAS